MSDKLTAAVDLALTAFGVVLFSMAVLTLILLVIRRAARAIEARRRSDPPASDTPVDEAVDPRTVAILAAAISAALDKPVRIHRVHLHSAHDRERWGRAGRMDILLSHDVRQNR